MQNKRTTQFIMSKNNFFAFLVGFTLIGVIMGVVAYCYMSDDFLIQIGIAQENFIEARRSSEFIVILIRSLSSSTMFLGAVFLLGFSAIAQPVEIGVLVIRGMGLGVTMAQVYSQGGKSGILTCAVLIVPAAVISVYALIIGTREAISMSNLMLKNSMSNHTVDGMLSTVKLYGTKFLVLEAVIAISAAVDCVCSVVLLNGLI